VTLEVQLGIAAGVGGGRSRGGGGGAASCNSVIIANPALMKLPGGDIIGSNI
jgi:hypothetical protein